MEKDSEKCDVTDFEGRRNHEPKNIVPSTNCKNQGNEFFPGASEKNVVVLIIIPQCYKSSEIHVKFLTCRTV